MATILDPDQYCRTNSIVGAKVKQTYSTTGFSPSNKTCKPRDRGVVVREACWEQSASIWTRKNTR